MLLVLLVSALCSDIEVYTSVSSGDSAKSAERGLMTSTLLASALCLAIVKDIRSTMMSIEIGVAMIIYQADPMSVTYICEL